MGHSHASERETENEDPHARTACGAPEKAKADPSPHPNGRGFLARASAARALKAHVGDPGSSLPAWRHSGELPGDDKTEYCCESFKHLNKVGIPSSAAMNSLGPGPKAARPELQKGRH